MISQLILININHRRL